MTAADALYYVTLAFIFALAGGLATAIYFFWIRKPRANRRAFPHVRDDVQ